MAMDNNPALEALLNAKPASDIKAALLWSPELVKFLVIGVLAFSGVALILATLLLWRSSAPANQILRVFGILTIVSFSAFLLVVGYSDQQLTPIIGLFGAIAGYLLGKDSKATKDE